MTNFGYLSHLAVSVKNNHLVGIRGVLWYRTQKRYYEVGTPPVRRDRAAKEG